MKPKEKALQLLAKTLCKTWSEQGALIFKVEPEKIEAMIVATLKADQNSEAELDRAVQKQLDDLERSHGGEFDRYRMYPLLKKKLAEEKGFIL